MVSTVYLLSSLTRAAGQKRHQTCQKFLHISFLGKFLPNLSKIPLHLSASRVRILAIVLSLHVRCVDFTKHMDLDQNVKENEST